jgi:hypothetical protein
VSIDGQAVPLQVAVLDRWADDSLRWVLLDFNVSPRSAGDSRYRLEFGRPAPRPPAALTVGGTSSTVSVDTGTGRFELQDDRLQYVCGDSDARSPLKFVSSFQVADSRHEILPVRVTGIAWETTGPLRCCALVTATLGPTDIPALELDLRYHFHAGASWVRLSATLRNPRRALHPGGFWDLGDEGSQYVEDFSYVVTVPDPAGSWQLRCSSEPLTAATPFSAPFELLQESSGGDRWQSTTHLDRAGAVPLRFRGYRVRSGDEETRGLRATPLVSLRHGACEASIVCRRFWQRFPKVISVRDGHLRLGLLPGECDSSHELQGGEQMTEEFVVAFGTPGHSDAALEWVRQPVRVSAPPEWYCEAEAAPHLTTVAETTDGRYQRLVNGAIDGPDTFAAKRERIDEYGWRHYGDLYADHETVRQAPGSPPLVSHYNNQYDAIAGFAIQFFRSGDARWLDLMHDLARHVIDIDIYHTTEDKPGYNHGLFWHTAHHIDAGLATHRTYPRASGASGGPASEHNYNTGLMLYYFLTGDVRAKDTAVDLGQWVIAMDDGRSTPLRWVTRQPTGFTSATGSLSYHGPGRAPGNSIVALMNACRLSGNREYLDKAEALIRRCIHPDDDVPALNLLDAERRWYYTVFLQAIGRYLEFKSERGEIDHAYAYARAALLHYARWMVEHEYPYLEKPEILEYPTETWAAHDMRKSEVFQYAAAHASPDDRVRFLERAEFFFDYSVSTLLKMETRTFTRPMVLMLTNGYAHEYFAQAGVPEMPRPQGTDDFGRPARFVPQKTVAMRRLAVGAVIAAAGVVSALLWMVLG